MFSGAGESLRLRDYVVAGAQAVVGIEPTDLRAPMDAFAAEALTRGIVRADVERLLDTAGIAVRNGRSSWTISAAAVRSRISGDRERDVRIPRVVRLRGCGCALARSIRSGLQAQS